MPETETLTPEAHAVEGSNGLLLEIDGQIVPNYDATLVPFNEGDVVTGRVVRIDKDEVLVDIGYKSEGVILSNELSIRKSANPFDEVEMGEEVDALVLTKEDQDGRLILSKKRARFEKAWRRIEAAAESGEPVEGTVIEVVKGGLIIDLGVRGFLPASLVDIRRVQNLDDFLGQKIECKVIELNRSRNNVVLSRRAVLEEERKEVRQQILDRLQPGQIVEGAISNIVDFGAFVDLDGIDGLIHISELSWSHVNHPSEILSIGDVVPVKVLDIDRDRQRISLGLKQTQEDPWQRVVDTYNLGDELEGRVTKVVSFGAFVEILDGVEGLVHISELAQHHVENPREVVNQGDVIRVRILEIDSERRRLSLSAKRVQDQELPLNARRRGRDRRGARARTLRRGLRRQRRRRGPHDRRGARDRRACARGRRRATDEVAPADDVAPRTRRRRQTRSRLRRMLRLRTRTRRPRTSRPSSRRPPNPAAESAAIARAAFGRGTVYRGPAMAAIPFVGLTGGIAAGKSEALSALERLGAATLSADAVVHELLDSDEIRDAARRALRGAGRTRRPGRPRALSARPSSRTPSSAHGSSGSCGRASGAGSGTGARRRSARERPAAGARRRGAAAVRGGHGGRVRPHDRDRRGRGASARERAGERGHAGLEERTAAPAEPGRKGAASGLRRRERRDHRRPRAQAAARRLRRLSA